MNRIIAALIASCTIPALAQTPRALTASDYAHAEKFMPYNVTPLVTHALGRHGWLPDDRFWYRVTTAEGSEFILVDPPPEHARRRSIRSN